VLKIICVTFGILRRMISYDTILKIFILCSKADIDVSVI